MNESGFYLGLGILIGAAVAGAVGIFHWVMHRPGEDD